jgi:hypothetical protein
MSAPSSLAEKRESGRSHNKIARKCKKTAKTYKKRRASLPSIISVSKECVACSTTPTQSVQHNLKVSLFVEVVMIMLEVLDTVLGASSARGRAVRLIVDLKRARATS